MKFSVIMPIYNAEKFLNESIESVLAQSFQDFELILVNDGSKDNSLYICTKYAKTNKCIKVIDVPNGGVSRARNIGLSMAKGEFICFIDSDDKVYKDWLLHYASNPQNADLLCCGLLKCYNDNKEIRNFEFDEYFSVDRIYDGVNKIITNGALNPPWSKCYKAQIIQHYNLRFLEGCHLYEDLIFSLQYLQHTNSIQLISYVGYKYCLDNSNLTRKFNVPEDFLSWSKKSVYEALTFVKNNDSNIIFKAISASQYQLTSYFILSFYSKISPTTRLEFYSYLSYLHKYINIKEVSSNLFFIYLVGNHYYILDKFFYIEHKLYKLIKG